MQSDLDRIPPPSVIQYLRAHRTRHFGLRRLWRGLSPPARQAACLPDSEKSAEQLFDAINQPLDCERLNQIFHVVLGKEECDFCVRGKAGDENETIG